MNISLQITANLAIVFEPFMPKKALELADLLNIKLPRWDQAGKDQLITENHIIKDLEILKRDKLILFVTHKKRLFNLFDEVIDLENK